MHVACPIEHETQGNRLEHEIQTIVTLTHVGMLVKEIQWNFDSKQSFGVDFYFLSLSLSQKSLNSRTGNTKIFSHLLYQLSDTSHFLSDTSDVFIFIANR